MTSGSVKRIQLPPQLVEDARAYADGSREPAEPRNAATVILLRRGGKHSDLVCQHCVCGHVLLGSEVPLEGHTQRSARVTLVANDCASAHVGERLAKIVEAPARETDVTRVILSAGDDARLVVGRQPHRLRLVELGILKRRQPKDPVSETRVQSFLGDVDLIAEN